MKTIKRLFTLHTAFIITILVLTCFSLLIIGSLFYFFSDNYHPTISAVIMDEHGVPGGIHASESAIEQTEHYQSKYHH